MARYQSSGRAHLGVGVPFPLKPNASGALQWVRHEAAVEQAILDILMTSPGERVMLPGYGAGLQDRVFDPNSASTHARIATTVRDALTRGESRIDVSNVTVTAAEGEPNLLLIDLDYVVRASNSSFNLVFPLYLSEGV